MPVPFLGYGRINAGFERLNDGPWMAPFTGIPIAGQPPYDPPQVWHLDVTELLSRMSRKSSRTITIILRTRMRRIIMEIWRFLKSDSYILPNHYKQVPHIEQLLPAGQSKSMAQGCCVSSGPA